MKFRIFLLLVTNSYLENFKNEEDDIPQEIKAIAEERLLARANKDWAKSDLLREELAKKGYEIKDAKDGYTLIKK